METFRSLVKYKNKSRLIRLGWCLTPYQRLGLYNGAFSYFEYTTIADRLRTVSWGNDSHPTGVVIPVYMIP